MLTFSTFLVENKNNSDNTSAIKKVVDEINRRLVVCPENLDFKDKQSLLDFENRNQDKLFMVPGASAYNRGNTEIMYKWRNQWIDVMNKIPVDGNVWIKKLSVNNGQEVYFSRIGLKGPCWIGFSRYTTKPYKAYIEDLAGWIMSFGYYTSTTKKPFEVVDLDEEIANNKITPGCIDAIDAIKFSYDKK